MDVRSHSLTYAFGAGFTQHHKLFAGFFADGFDHLQGIVTVYGGYENYDIGIAGGIAEAVDSGSGAVAGMEIKFRPVFPEDLPVALFKSIKTADQSDLQVLQRALSRLSARCQRSIGYWFHFFPIRACGLYFGLQLAAPGFDPRCGQVGLIIFIQGQAHEFAVNFRFG